VREREKHNQRQRWPAANVAISGARPASLIAVSFCMYYRWMVEQFFIGFFCAVVVRCMLLAAATSCVRWRVASLYVSRGQLGLMMQIIMPCLWVWNVLRIIEVWSCNHSLTLRSRHQEIIGENICSLLHWTLMFGVQD